jgi:hypothetical protein
MQPSTNGNHGLGVITGRDASQGAWVVEYTRGPHAAVLWDICGNRAMKFVMDAILNGAKLALLSQGLVISSAGGCVCLMLVPCAYWVLSCGLSAWVRHTCSQDCRL